MRTIVALALSICFVLFISIKADEKDIDKNLNMKEYLKCNISNTKIKEFNFTGLRDSILKGTSINNNYHTKKLWGYIK